MKRIEQSRAVRLSTHRRAAQWLVIVALALAVAVVYGGAVAPVGRWVDRARGVQSRGRTVRARRVPRLPVRHPQDPRGADAARRRPTGSDAPNTNLEQVSDWLTKIALGPRWRPLLRNLATPAAGSTEDDLVAMVRDPELRSLLGL